MTKNFSEETEQDEGNIKVRKSRKGFTLCEQKKKMVYSGIILI